MNHSFASFHISQGHNKLTLASPWSNIILFLEATKFYLCVHACVPKQTKSGHWHNSNNRHRSLSRFLQCPTRWSPSAFWILDILPWAFPLFLTAQSGFIQNQSISSVEKRLKTNTKWVKCTLVHHSSVSSSGVPLPCSLLDVLVQENEEWDSFTSEPVIYLLENTVKVVLQERDTHCIIIL
jgi:hypothetical protein